MSTEPNPYKSAAKSLGSSRSHISRVVFWASCVTVAVVSLTITAVVSFLIGVVIGESSSYHRRAIAQIDSIETFLNQYPEKYSNVTIHEASDGYAYIMGDVKTKKEFDLLQTELQRLFGVEVAREMLWRVDVATPMNQLGQASTIQWRQDCKELTKLEC